MHSNEIKKKRKQQSLFANAIFIIYCAAHVTLFLLNDEISAGIGRKSKTGWKEGGGHERDK